MRRVLLQLREPRDDARVPMHGVHAAEGRRQNGELRSRQHVRTRERPKQVAHHFALVDARIRARHRMGRHEVRRHCHDRRCHSQEVG
jgi:hypothetical protein